MKHIQWNWLFGLKFSNKPKIDHPHSTKTIKDIQEALQPRAQFRATKCVLNDGVRRSQQIMDIYHKTGRYPDIQGQVPDIHLSLLDDEPH